MTARKHRHLVEVWFRPGLGWRWMCNVCRWLPPGGVIAAHQTYVSPGYAGDAGRRHLTRTHKETPDDRP